MIVLIIENFNFKKEFKDLKDCIDFFDYVPSEVLSVKVLKDNEVILEGLEDRSYILNALKVMFLKEQSERVSERKRC